jgi:HAD superfamily hydrolase (TIGR01490 family)
MTSADDAKNAPSTGARPTGPTEPTGAADTEPETAANDAAAASTDATEPAAANTSAARTAAANTSAASTSAATTGAEDAAAGEAAIDTDAATSPGHRHTPPMPHPTEPPRAASIPRSDPSAAAFFDVDNTLMRGGSLFYLARGLHSRRFFSTREILTAGWQQLKFRVIGSEDPDHVRQIREQALAFIAGWPVADLVELAAEIFDEVLTTKVWPGTAALAQHHLDHGERVWLVTAAPVEIAQLIADRLNLTGGLGTVAETRDGYYTGRLVGDLLHGAAKADAVRLLAAEQNLDLSRCSAYSDSANDVPMLSLVGTPYAINPDRRLRAHARERGWRIRDFRRGRRAARAGLAGAALVGAIGGAAAAAAALRRNTGRRHGRRGRPS